MSTTLNQVIIGDRFEFRDQTFIKSSKWNDRTRSIFVRPVVDGMAVNVVIELDACTLVES